MRVRTHAGRRALVVLAVVSALATPLVACDSGDDAAASPSLPGVTGSTVDLAFTIGEYRATLAWPGGDPSADTTGRTNVINAIVKHINSRGGMGGRQVKATVTPYDVGTVSDAQSASQCAALTQGRKVMAAVLDGGIRPGTVACYAAADTLVLPQALVAFDQTAFAQNSPYLWSPTFPEYSGFTKAQLAAMDSAGWFDGARGVLIVSADTEVARRTTTTLVEPYLQSIGVLESQTEYVEVDTIERLAKTTTAALTTGRSEQLDRVLVVGGERIAPVALSDQASIGYASRWGMSTYDNPAFVGSNPEVINTELRTGMTGLGFAPALDVGDDESAVFPDPANAAQKQCHDVVTSAGYLPRSTRSDWRPTLLTCDALFFLKAALDTMPGQETVTGADFEDAVAKIGSTYRSSLALGSQWGPGVYAGTNTGKALSWKEGCECFRYSGAPITFSPGPVAAATESTAP